MEWRWSDAEPRLQPRHIDSDADRHWQQDVEALVGVLEALADHAHDAKRWERGADLLLDLGYHGAARGLYTVAWRLAPELLERWTSQASDRSPGSPDDPALTWLEYRLFTIGLGLNDADCYEEAIIVFQRLQVLLGEEFSMPWTLEGMALCNLRRYAQALPVLERALTLDARDIGAWTEKVRALYALDRREEAEVARQQEYSARCASGVPAWMPSSEKPT